MFTQLNKSNNLTELRIALHDVPQVLFYVLGPGLPGSIGNFWASSAVYPPFEVKPLDLYLSRQGTLQAVIPPQSGQATYLFDPANPVPTIGGNNLILPCGPLDQSSLYLQRRDIISFTTEKLNKAILICGQIDALLYVSSNATDTDFTAKLVDVFPDSRNMLVQDGIIRMRWRDGPTTPKLMTPGSVYEVIVDIWSVCYVFNPGHKIRLDISSSNAPRFSVNPNNGLLIDQNGPNVVAQNSIYVGFGFPSRLNLPLAINQTLHYDPLLKYEAKEFLSSMKWNGPVPHPTKGLPIFSEEYIINK